jgi:14-3-3 protein epsilon
MRELDQIPSMSHLAPLLSDHDRYQDMVAAMKQIAALATEAELTIEERNLLSVAYKNQVR